MLGPAGEGWCFVVRLNFGGNCFDNKLGIRQQRSCADNPPGYRIDYSYHGGVACAQVNTICGIISGVFGLAHDLLPAPFGL